MASFSVNDTAQRTLHFACGWQGSGVLFSASCQSKAIHASPTQKRRRVDGLSIVQVRLVELIRDLDEAKETNRYFGVFLWPSALLLSQFVAREAKWLCCNKVVLELGCGTGLPSILAGLGGAAKVYLTDRAGASDVQRNAEINITLNELTDRAQYRPLTWGNMLISDEMISIFQTAQLVLGADCFYQSQDFEKVIATVALIFRCTSSPSCKFYFTYQLRSINRSIAHLFSRWKLTTQSIDKRMYIHDLIEIGGHSVQDFDSIYLYVVTRAT